MRRLAIILALSIVSLASYGQRYRDIYPEIANTTNDETALSLIKTYMVEDLDHPNANLRLALIYENRYQNADPLTQFERTIANAQEAALRFIKAKTLIDDKEVKKNSGWYAEFSSGVDSRGRAVVEFSAVSSKIQHGYDSSRLLTQKLPPIYDAFTESVDFYDQAIKIFAEINGKYTSYDKLLLLFDKDLNQKLETLKVKYDSSLFYLDKYISLIDEYPIKGYNQSYSIDSIKTYRLEGLLTSPNFLTNNITIWNYKAWANKVQNDVNSDIVDLREKLNQAEIALNSSLKVIEDQSYNENFNPHIIDKKLEFDLRKFDNESLPVALLKYKEFKQDLLLKNNATLDFDSALSSDLKNVYFGELIYLTNDADSLLNIASSRVEDETFQKYPDYFNSHYGSKATLTTYLGDEKNLSKRLLTKSVEKLRENILGELSTTAGQNEFYTYRRLKIPASIESVNIDSIKNDFHSTHEVQSADGSKYVGGVVKSSRAPNPVKTSIIKVDENEKVAWYKEFELLESSRESQTNLLGNLTITPEGCALAIHTYDIDSVVNHVIYLDENGEEIFNVKLETKSIPRLSQYTESNSSLLLSFKGDAPEQSLKNQETLDLVSINLIGDVLWQKKFEYSGNIESLITTSDGFMVLGNFSSITNTNGQRVVTKINEGQTNAFAARFDPQGNGLSIATFNSNEKYKINKVVKINDSVINLMGYKDPSGRSIHLIINKYNRVIYSDL